MLNKAIMLIVIVDLFILFELLLIKLYQADRFIILTKFKLILSKYLFLSETEN